MFSWKRLPPQVTKINFYLCHLQHFPRKKILKALAEHGCPFNAVAAVTYYVNGALIYFSVFCWHAAKVTSERRKSLSLCDGWFRKRTQYFLRFSQSKSPFHCFRFHRPCHCSHLSEQNEQKSGGKRRCRGSETRQAGELFRDVPFTDFIESSEKEMKIGELFKRRWWTRARLGNWNIGQSNASNCLKFVDSLCFVFSLRPPRGLDTSRQWGPAAHYRRSLMTTVWFLDSHSECCAAYFVRPLLSRHNQWHVIKKLIYRKRAAEWPREKTRKMVFILTRQPIDRKAFTSASAPFRKPDHKPAIGLDRLIIN